MDAKRRPPPIPEKTVAGMPPAKPPVPGPLPTPPNQHESQAGRVEDGEATNQAPSNADGGEHHPGNSGANERFDPPVGGQFTSPAVALMDPMKKQARRKSNPPPGYPNQHQNALPPGASPSQMPGASSGYVGKGASAVSSNGVQGASDGIQQVQPTVSQPQKHLRSPSVKRAPGASVTMQGWLHKQGSEGLMLWKRRWFVLSEFCLFYYKGPEEDKVLGSILLPSYVISPCSSEEPKRGGHRKHSFKAEHHNMRTYYFAAESSESMERWMYNMNLATLLQRNFATGAVSEGVSWDERQSGRPSVSSFSSLLNQSADDSDSGFHGGRSPKHATIAVGSANSGQSAAVPTWATKGKKLEEETLSEISRERDAVMTYRKGAETTPEVPSLPAEFQPLYANAPPKPRRLNSGGRDYSTSPERSPERKGEEDSVVLRSKVPVNESQQNGMYVDRTQRTSRPMVSYASIRHERNSSYQQQTAQVQHPVGIPTPNQMGFPVVDRRTPDTYGRSNTGENSTAGIPKMVPNKVDYEDVYSVNHNSDQVMGRMNRWSSGPYETQHFYPTEIHQTAVQQQPPHVHLFPPSGHSPQQGLQQHTHGAQLGVVQRMPIAHPYTVSPTTAQHQHPPLPQPHVSQQLMPPQPQPQMFHRRTPPLPRPHSADFLGHYDHNQMSYVMPLPTNLGSRTPSIEHPSPKIPTGAAEELQKPYKNIPAIERREHHVTDVVSAQQIQRPKSSMDIRPVSQTLSFDPTDYWSEESYARMMRQSLYMHAHHVHPSSSSSHKGSETSSGMGHQQLQNWSAYPPEASPAVTHQSAPRLPQITQKPQAIEPVDLRHKGVEDMAATIPQRQSAPSGKRDLNQGGYFLRSASARMPRSRYHSGDSQRDQPSVLSTMPGEEAKNGEKKMQQREESMRRLLEWKQRMLQSPLTRKSSSSNSPRKHIQDNPPQNSSQMGSSHYKQMVLKQLANQEAQASTNTSEHSTRRGGNRRGPDDIRSARSRSHDGRRSSASLSRYNSYSSDDEEALGESRKRVRRCPQAGRGRRGVGSGDDPPTPPKNPSSAPPLIPPPKLPQSQHQQQHHHHHHHHQKLSPKTISAKNEHHPPHSSVDHSRHNNHCDRSAYEGYKSPLPPEAMHLTGEGGGIPPDASYADVESSGQCADWHSTRWDQSGILHPLPSPEKRLHFEDEICKRGREIRASSRIGNDIRHMADVNDNTGQPPEKLSHKQSLNVGFARNEKQGQNEGKENRKNAASVKEVQGRDYLEINIPEMIYTEENVTSKLKSWKTPHDLRSKRENPPKNIVQNRIKEFEPKDSDEKESKSQQMLPPPPPEMKEPLNPSPSSYTANEAHIYPLRSKGAKKRDMEMSEIDRDILTSFDRRGQGGGGATADIESSDEGTSSPPPPLPTSSPPTLPVQKSPTATVLETASYKATPSTKSVRELLADFERKSEQKKKRMEEEEANAWDSAQGLSNGGKGGREQERFLPGRRYVFSDTETLLYDTGSDLDEDSELSKQWKTRKEDVMSVTPRDPRANEEVKQKEKTEVVMFSSGEVAEEGDSEVESALSRRNRFSGANSLPTGNVEQGKNSASQGGYKTVVESSEAMEVITTPGYLRLSLAESLVTHEDLVSPFGSSADATPPLPTTKNPAEEEEHYMPMTPSRKSLLASPSSLQPTGTSPTSASHSIIMESVFGSNGTFWAQVDAEEESSYVEMTEEGLVKSLLVSETLTSSLAPFSIFASPLGRNNLELCRKNSGESTATYAVPESPSYTEIPPGGIFESALGRNPTSHYELLSRASTQYEPVYMEVRSVKEGANQRVEEANRLCIKNGKANAETSRTVAGSDDERSLRKEKKKKSKCSTPDREDTGGFSKEEEFPDRKAAYPSDACRLNMGGMLPDILSNSSSANQRRSLEEEIGTESSDVGDEEDEEDADDEASKDLDSLDAPRHPRFSLSDTFRPASYYLGASDRTFAVGGAGKGGLGGGDSGSGLMNMVGGGVDASANELQGDSSDSDLVSPPPIPTSPPPPLDDDEDVLGESVEDSDDKKLSTKTLSNAHLQTTGVCKNPPLVQRSVISPTFVQPDGSSMSDVSDTASTVCSLRRRPVTGNILDSLINSAPNKSDIPSELYRRRNEILNEYGDYKRQMDFDTPLSPSLPPELWPRPEDGLPSALPEALHRRIASADDAAVLYENVHVIMKPRNQMEAVRPPLPPHRSTTPFIKTSESPIPHMATERVKSPETVKMHTHIRGSSHDGETQGAPYYYSDLLRGECEESEFFRTASERGPGRSMHPSPSSWRHARMPLNNQRDDLMEIAAKRNDVGRKVNRIQPPIEPLHIAAFRRAEQTHRMEHSPEFPRDNCEGVEKLMAADLLLIGADKRVDFDERNIYETDTLKKAGRMRRSKDQQWENQSTSQPQHSDSPMHRRCYTPDSLPDSRVTRNIYPYGLMDKSNDSEISGGTYDALFSQQNGFQERANRWRRRSRSLEGLLDDENDSLFVSNPVGSCATGRQSYLTSPPFHNVEVNTWDRPQTTTEIHIDTTPPSVNQEPPIITATANFNGADPWNEDNLWRESLRRVSLRHTRSLDHLDDCSSPGPNPNTASGRRSVDLLAGNEGEAARKSKVSRGVTYVNDRVAVARNRHRPVSKPPTIEDVNRRVVAGFERVNEVREGYDRYSGRIAGRDRALLEHQPYSKDSYDCDESKVTRRAAEGQTPTPDHFLGEDAPPSPPQSPPPGEDPGPGFEIDREKLRQWDLMSSAPLPGMAAGTAGAVGKVIVAGGRRGAGTVEAGGGEGKGLPRADETVARGEGETGRVGEESETSGGQSQKQQESRMSALVTTASGSGSIREPAPIRHSKNDPSSTMLVISQPTSIPIQSPTYVQPPNARLGVPQLKQHSAQPHGTEVEGEAEGKARQWRGNEGMVTQGAPMMRWERDNIPPIRKPEDPAITERDFHSMQRNMTTPKHDVLNGGGGRGRKGRESGEADKAGERKRGDGGRGDVSVSAGDLLGRTHEELVLLLIQLRRQSAAVSNAIDLCQADLSAQARLAELEMHRRVEHLKKLEELKKHLLELEKQYEKGKPLINLVDNMVKLGSLYRGNTDAQGRIRGWRGTGGEANTGPSPAKDRLQFNQRVQEQRLLAEERRDWSRLSPDHGELQAKVQQLYRLDRLLQEESVTIQSLQQDKELLEKALGGLRHKLQGSGVPNIGSAGSTPRDLNSTKGMVGGTPAVDPAEAERYRKQQRMLERELSRVRQLLAQNSKKLEETVAENARLEQELVVLRQKLQLSRRTIDNHSTSQSPGSAGTNPASPSGATASLEAELRRVQSAVGDLQRQRHELSVQVRQLTEKSHSLVEQIRPGPTGVAGAGPIPAKKRHHSTWMETDLDSMESMDCGIESPGPGPSPSRGAPILQPMVHSPAESTPLYVNTTLGQHVERDDVNRRSAAEDQPSMANGYELAGEAGEEAQGYQAMDINEADDRMKRFYGIIPREKPEIKTVRIVKRESERRHRDRSSKRVVLVDDPSENPSSTSSLNRVLEEEPVEGEEEEEAMAYHAHHQQSQQLHNMSSSVPFSPGFLGPPEDDPILSQFFQRSLSLPRALGKQRGQPPPVPPPPPLRVASPRGSSAAVRRQQLRLRSEVTERPRSAHEQLFGTSQEDPPCLQQQSLSYSMLPSYSSSPSSHSASPTLFTPTDRSYPPLPPTPDSPPPIAYKSEAAREIALEMAALHSGEDWANGGRDSVKKRATPKEKRRHYTVSCSRPLELESIVLPKMGSARSRDDLDMEQVLRPRLNAPDVVRSTMSHRDFKYNEHTIDSVLGTPNKIVIPERYIPEQAPELSEEEQMHRLKKAEAIRKMLSETTPITAPEVEENQQKKTSIIKKKVAEEKRQRDHILQLNQILAKQVMEKSKMVAGTTPVAEYGTQD